MPRFDRGSLAAAALVLVTLVLGIVGGIALERWVLRPERPAARGSEFRMVRGGFDPANIRTRFSRQLADELGLSTDQRRAVDSILRLQQERSRAVMRESQPRLREVVRETETAMRGILTPDQWRRWHEIRLERMQRRPRRQMVDTLDTRTQPENR